MSDMYADLAEGLRGALIRPGDASYDSARQLYNGMINKRPGAIARCVDVADVMTAVRFGRENDVLVAIRGGGHNGPGLGSCDGGLVVDLAELKGVRVNPKTRTVRVGAGCTQGDVDHATHPFGLAVPAGIVSSTGIAGLALGGGHGYLTRQYGLTIDNLLEADVVLADGRFVTASATENSDLYWGLRGGGGNFGVVTSFLFQAHPVSRVHAGPMFFALEDAGVVMRWYREFLPTAPEKLFVFCGLKTVPSADAFPPELHGRKVCALVWCFDGSVEDARGAMNAAEELPQPLLDGRQDMAFRDLQSMFDPLMPPGMQWYWKGDFVRELTDDAIDVHLSRIRESPSELSLMHLYPIDGAVHRTSVEETAWSYRDVRWSMVIAGIDPDPNGAEAVKAWARGYWDALHPHCEGGAYINFMMEEGDERVQATYQRNYERLVAVKREYDPDNFFRVNQNIRPD